MKRLWVLTLMLALLLGGCAKPKNPYADIEQNPVATITMRNGDTMRFELYPQVAPITVANFIDLANEGKYDGLEVFRVASNVLIQSGDPKNDGTGDQGFYIKGEFSENGVENTLSHMRGTISMARKSKYDTASSQFFIMQGSYPEYDGKYAAFGRIMDDESLSTLDAIGSTPVDGNYEPFERVYIQRIRVETYGVEYEPVRIEDMASVDDKEDKKQ